MLSDWLYLPRLKACSVLGQDRECRLVAIQPIYAAGATTWASAFRDMAAGLGIGLGRLLSIEAGTERNRIRPSIGRG